MTSTPTPPPPDVVAAWARRTTEGAGRPCLFLPFVGEFGHQVMTHVRWVHFHRASAKVVCCRPSDRALYPSADRFVTDWVDPVRDHDRVGTIRDRAPAWPHLLARYPMHVPIDPHGLTPEQELLTIAPGERVPFAPRRRGLAAVDVAIGVRNREMCPERNWRHWQRLADALAAAGRTFAVVGRRPTSYDLDGQAWHTGDHSPATDAALETLQGCRLYVGTDSGCSHLAAAAGARMLVFREQAWGSRDLTPHMARANPGRVRRLYHAWERPDAVVAHALAMLQEHSPPATMEASAAGPLAVTGERGSARGGT